MHSNHLASPAAVRWLEQQFPIPPHAPPDCPSPRHLSLPAPDPHLLPTVMRYLQQRAIPSLCVNPSLHPDSSMPTAAPMPSSSCTTKKTSPWAPNWVAPGHCAVGSVSLLDGHVQMSVLFTTAFLNYPAEHRTALAMFTRMTPG